MKKITIAVVSYALVATTAIPARANDDLLRFGIGVGATLLGEAIKNRNIQPQPRRSTPRPSRTQAAPRSEPAKPRRVPDEDVRSVQQRLHDLGYTEVGIADGFWGRNTASAVAAFMSDNGMDGDPRMSDSLISALKTAKHRDVLLAEAKAKEREAAVEANLPPSKVKDSPSEKEVARTEKEITVAPEDAVDHAAEAEKEVVSDLEPKARTDGEAAVVEPPVEQEPDVAEETVTLEPETGKAEVADIEDQEESSDPEQVNGLIISSDF